MAPTDQIEWNSLLKSVKRGVEADRNRLFQALEVRLRPVLQSRLWGWPKEETEDILQNTLMVMIEKLDQISENPHYFALTVLRNKIGDALRNRKAHRETGYDLGHSSDRIEDSSPEERSAVFADPTQDISGQAEYRDMAQNIFRMIDKLSKFCKMVFLSVMEERPLSEVWELSELEPQLTRSAFDKRVFDCRKRMRHNMQGFLQP